MTIAATPYLIEDAPAVAARLARVLRKPEDELLASSRAATPASPTSPAVGRPAPAACSGWRSPGSSSSRVPAAIYPRDWMASQLLGSVGTDGNGPRRARVLLDEHLRGEDGERRLVKDALGDAIELREDQPAVPGADVELTLDANVQDHAEEVLAEVGEEWKPKGATAIVMDPRDGGILALANWPRVNANALGDAPAYARQNRAVGATYEPGSTFKAFTVAAALEEGEVEAQHEFDLPPTIKVADREIGEAHDAGYRRLTTRQILEPVLQRRLGHDRPAARRRALRPVDPALRLRQARPGSTCPARSRASCSTSRSTRVLDGQPADRPGPRRDADADGRRLRRDRQRRDPAPPHIVERVDARRPPSRRATA